MPATGFFFYFETDLKSANMQKHLRLVAGLAFIFLFVNAVNGQFVYNSAFSTGNTSDDAGYSITADAGGNIYVAGNYTYWIDIDPGGATQYLTSIGGLDGYVAKINSSGGLVWAFTIGGTLDDNIFSIKTDINNNVLIAGRFRGTVDFDPSAGVNNFISNGGDDIFIAKYNVNGNLLWANTFGGAENDEAFELAYDAGSNNVMVTGSFKSASVDMDPNGTQVITNLSTPGFGYDDIFVACYSASTAALQWVFGIGGTNSDGGHGVTTDNQGNVFVTGSFSGSNVDFDPGNGSQLLNSAGSVDAYIAKYNGSGAYQWAHRIGNAYGEIGYSLACDNSGNLYTGGYFNSDSVDFDPGAGTNYIHTGGVQDLFVIKLNNSGVYQWAFGVGDFNSEVAQDIAVTGTGNIFICGSFGHTVDFDPGNGIFNLVGDPTQDGYLAQYTAGGSFVDAIPFTGNGYEFGIGVCTIASNKVGVTGWFSTATVDFDPGAGIQNLTNSGTSTTWTDAFVATYTYTPTGIILSDETASAFHVYPNPAGSELAVKGREKVEELKIMDMLGKEIMQTKIEEPSEFTRIQTAGLQSGIYFIRIKTKDNTVEKKFVKL